MSISNSVQTKINTSKNFVDLVHTNFVTCLMWKLKWWLTVQVQIVVLCPKTNHQTWQPGSIIFAPHQCIPKPQPKTLTCRCYGDYQTRWRSPASQRRRLSGGGTHSHPQNSVSGWISPSNFSPLEWILTSQGNGLDVHRACHPGWATCRKSGYYVKRNLLTWFL